MSKTGRTNPRKSLSELRRPFVEKSKREIDQTEREREERIGQIRGKERGTDREKGIVNRRRKKGQRRLETSWLSRTELLGIGMEWRKGDLKLPFICEAAEIEDDCERE